MEGSELSLVALTPADIDAGLALSGAAGWNQTANDWALFIEQGRAVGFRTGSGVLVATTASIVYGGRFGWLSMVLVAHEWRHRGLASLLMAACVERLQAAQITPVLDATPAGEPVYRHLGFRRGFGFERWQGEGGAAASDRGLGPAVRTASAADFETILALDQAANRVGRRVLLHNLLQRPATRAWIHRDGSGFVCSREGRRARHIGPLVAPDEAGAIALLTTALAAADGPVFIDVPERWPGLARVLEAAGFSRQRPFVRMALGSSVPLTCGEQAFVFAGPEYG